MKQKKTILIIAAVILTLDTLGFLLAHKSVTSTNSTIGVIVSVMYRQNPAKDGYYGFNAQTDSGRKYSVNATT